MEKYLVTRPSLGRMAQMGELFDARREKFLSVPFLSLSDPAGYIHTVDNRLTNFQNTQGHTLSEKLKEMNIGGELGVSIMSGLVGDVQGAGKYLLEESTSKSGYQSTLHFSILTQDQTLELAKEGLLKHVNTNVLGPESSLSKGATHVVVKISWGASIIVNVVYEEGKGSRKSDQEGRLKAQSKLKKFIASLQATLEGKSTEEDKDFYSELKIQLYGDIIPDQGFIGIEEIHKIIRSFPSLVEKCNNGKGKPVQYGLLPISAVQKHFGLPMSSLEWTELSEDISNSFVIIFDRITKLKRNIHKLLNQTKDDEEFIPVKYTTELYGKLEDIKELEIALKRDLRDAVVNARQTQDGIETFLQLGRKYGTENVELQEVEDFARTAAQSITKRLAVVKGLAEEGIVVLHVGESLESKLLGRKGRTYVLYSSSENSNVQATNILLQLKARSQLMRRNDDLFLYVDVDLFSDKEDEEENDEKGTDNEDESKGSECEDEEEWEEEEAEGESQIGKIHEYNQEGELVCDDVEKELKGIKVEGEYSLVDNGNYDEYLCAIGLGYAMRTLQLWSSSNLTISRNEDERWTMLISTSVGSVKHSFKLGEVFGEKTGDGWDAQSKVEKVLNVLDHSQQLSDGKNTERRTIRFFTKKEMLVTLEAGNVRATRRYERCK